MVTEMMAHIVMDNVNNLMTVEPSGTLEARGDIVRNTEEEQ